MSERYSRLLLMPKNIYASGSPVLIVAGALLQDTQTGNVLAQLKLKNIGTKPIKAASVSIQPLDTIGNLLGSAITFQYLDLTAKRYEEFGVKTPIILPDASTRSYHVSLKEVVFTDNTVWQSDGQPWEALTPPSSLESILKGPELVTQYRIQFGDDCQYMPTVQKDLWFCACGEVNRQGEDGCYHCGKSLNTLLAVDVKQLQQGADRRKAKAETAQIIKTQKAKKQAIIFTPIVCMVLAFFILLFTVIVPNAQKNNQYEYAVSLLESDNSAVAAIEFAKLGNWSDSAMRSKTLWDKIATRDTLCAGYNFTVGIKTDGTVVAAGYNEHGACNTDSWTDIVAVSAGAEHAVGLKADGTVVAAGSNEFGQCNVAGWVDIVSVCAGYHHTIGLKADGTVVAVGDNDSKQCNVSEWENIVSICAGANHTAGLKTDGTVVIVGNNGNRQYDASKWTDVVAISANYNYTVALRADGTTVIAGNTNHLNSVKKWKDIIAISAGCYHAVGLKADGTVVAAGENDRGQCEFVEWQKGYDEYAAGAIGYPWSDIVYVCAGGIHTVALKADGTVLVAGPDLIDKNEIRQWKNIKIPG